MSTTQPADSPTDAASPTDADKPDRPDEPGDTSAGDDGPGYAAAMAELEQILEELEGEDPDVDLLAARVERAATLIEVCRGRIERASVSVERVVAALESGG